MSANSTAKRYGSAASAPVTAVAIAIIVGLLIPSAAGLQAQKKDVKIEAEIIKTSRIPSQWPEFKINRDIFSPDVMRPQFNRRMPPPPPPPKITKEQEEKIKEQKEIEEDMERELRMSFFYEGYVIRASQKDRNFALVSLNGEFTAAGAGDIVGEKITIVSITKELIKVEVENNVFEIQLKGDNEDDK